MTHPLDRLVAYTLGGGRPRALFFVDLLAGVISLLFTPREEEPQIVVPVVDVFVAAPGLDMTHRQLSGWNGTPLHEKNVGAAVEERTHLVSIAPSDQFQAIVLIEQGDRNELIHKDDFAERLAKSESQTIELKFDHLPALTYEGTVEYVSKNTMDYVPELLSNKLGGELATVTDGQGRERLASPVYQATVRVTKDLELLRTGMRGKARFLVEERTAGQWLWRYLRQTFHFRL